MDIKNFKYFEGIRFENEYMQENLGKKSKT